jgi:hypothetical protein
MNLKTSETHTHTITPTLHLRTVDKGDNSADIAQLDTFEGGLTIQAGGVG